MAEGPQRSKIKASERAIGGRLRIKPKVDPSGLVLSEGSSRDGFWAVLQLQEGTVHRIIRHLACIHQIRAEQGCGRLWSAPSIF